MIKIKNKLIEISKKMHQLGLNIGSEGNISIKRNDTIFITPSGVHSDQLDDEGIAIVDIKGNLKNKKKPSSEILMHLYLYRARPEINSIVHCHSTWATVLSCSRKKIPAFHYMVGEFGGNDVKCSKYATFGTKKLASNVLSVIKDRSGCLISNHGQITVADNIENAFNLAIALEKLSKQYFLCKLQKDFKILSNKEMLKISKLFKNYKVKH
tara:strand:- start:491 stop:1123 length:633 start_codon:yes stop_codon:yes gene_type:complete